MQIENHIPYDLAFPPILDDLTSYDGEPNSVYHLRLRSLPRLYLGPDASCVYPDCAHSRIVDGQLFRLDGTPIRAKDAVTLKDGTVFVQKDATLVSLQQVEIMGMNDGTSVHGDGLIRSKDGTTLRLKEGETILIEGVATRR